jgi:hypothetical protein
MMRIEPTEEKTLAQEIVAVKAKTGVLLLTDEDVLALACAEIARTYTYEEKGYLRQCPNNQPR